MISEQKQEESLKFYNKISSYKIDDDMEFAKNKIKLQN